MFQVTKMTIVLITLTNVTRVVSAKAETCMPHFTTIIEQFTIAYELLSALQSIAEHAQWPHELLIVPFDLCRDATSPEHNQ